MKVELKIVNLTKSKIMQMVFIAVPSDPLSVVLGWVNIDKKRFTIIKLGDGYYRGSYVSKVNKKTMVIQFPANDGGYEFPKLTHVSYESFNNGTVMLTNDRDDAFNIKLYERIVSYKEQTEIAGQIYY